jgi:hypothetical protein
MTGDDGDGDGDARGPSLIGVLVLLVAASLFVFAIALVASGMLGRQRTAEERPEDPPGPGLRLSLPNSVRLDFLTETCADGCRRDAHWMDPRDPTKGTGVWVAHRPFHVREGFLAEGLRLDAGFEVRLLITRRDGPRVEGGAGPFPIGTTFVHEADFIVRGTTEYCGPTYAAQDGPQDCVWFVHDFPGGLPEGRYDIRAEWHAPCSAWHGLGFAEACPDPDATRSMFNSFVNAPFEVNPLDDPMEHAAPVSIGQAGIDDTSE